MADGGSGMTGHWWERHAWGPASLELLVYLQSRGAVKDETLERTFWYANLPRSCDATGEMVSLSTPELAMPGDFIHESFLKVGEPMGDSDGHPGYYEPLDSDSKPTPFEQWSRYNRLSQSRYLGNDIETDAVYLSSRASSLLSSTKWTDAEANEIVGLIVNSIEAQKVFYAKLSDKTLELKDEPWEVALRHNLTSMDRGVDGRWNEFLRNPYLPLSGDVPGSSGYAYRKVAEAILDAQVEALDKENFNLVSTASLEAFVGNENTPTDLLRMAHDVLSRTYSAPGEIGSYYVDGGTKSIKEAEFKPLMFAAERHPNFGGVMNSEALARASHGMSDEELVSLFAEDKPFSPLKALRLYLYVPDLMTDPSREGLIREIVSGALAADDHLVLALFLPAVATILEEFLEAMGTSTEQVPLEWLITALT